jgi:hypothetical protein
VKRTSIELFTLVSGDYVYGAAALCNSLHAAKFDGLIHVGCIGELQWSLDPAAPIIVHHLSPTDKWIGNYKPAYIAEHASGIYIYIDADCIVTTPGLIENVIETVAEGPIFCAEGIVPGTDIRRLRWRRAKESCLGRDSASAPSRLSDIYYNSGFFCGHIQRDRWILESWMKIIETSLSGTGSIFETRDFPMPDQDCLNALIQDEEMPFYCVSPPDVWYAATQTTPFLRVGTLEAALLHCTGREKPWRHSFVPPRAPNAYERYWYRYLDEHASWARCPIGLGKSVRSWLRDEAWGRGISHVKSLAKRLHLR